MLFSIEEGAALSAQIEAAFDTGGEHGVLEVQMPNGKAFGECTADDLREVSKAYNGLATRHALTPSGLLARKFFNGVYLEMANARLGEAALRQAGRDYERAKLILRRSMAADPVILTHLLECALDDEVAATMSALKAKASVPEHAGGREAATGALKHLLRDGLASVHELEQSRQSGESDLRGITNYELAARCTLELIQAAAAWSVAGAAHTTGRAAPEPSTARVAGSAPYEDRRSTMQRSDGAMVQTDAPGAHSEISRRPRADDGRAEANQIVIGLENPGVALLPAETLDDLEMPGPTPMNRRPDVYRGAEQHVPAP
jgi:hypothetical protein